LTERVLLDVVAPDLTVTARPGGEDGTVAWDDLENGFAFAGLGEPNANVVLTFDGIDYSTIVNQLGAWAISIPAEAVPEAGGEVEVVVQSSDAAGNVTIADPISLTIEADDNDGPSDPFIFVFTDQADSLSLASVDDSFLSSFAAYTGTFDLLGGNDSVGANDVEDLVFDLGSGADEMELTNSVDTVVRGNKGHDHITVSGTTGSLIDGGGGRDLIEVAGTTDTQVEGGKGADTFIIGDGAEVQVDGGQGADRFVLEDDGSFDVTIAGFAGPRFKHKDKISVSQAMYDALTEDWAAMVSVDKVVGGRRSEVKVEFAEDQVMVLSGLKFRNAAQFEDSDALDDYFEIY
jgi:hypothetical protein